MSKSWDLGLDYKQVYKMILAKVKEHISRRAFASYCYACVLLIQLRNGSRVSEAVSVFIIICSTQMLINPGIYIYWCPRVSEIRGALKPLATGAELLR
jgi:hypothetical protein